MSNILTIAAEDKKKKKGGGTNAVLTLMKELADFQDKVSNCIDAQDLHDRRVELENFYDKLDEMAEVLLNMADQEPRNENDRVSRLKNQLVSLNDNNSLILEIPESPVM
jgi:hypothetical protein